jgi:hypothetical protein
MNARAAPWLTGPGVCLVGVADHAEMTRDGRLTLTRRRRAIWRAGRRPSP